jgi:predicted alpha/beta hydrolase
VPEVRLSIPARDVGRTFAQRLAATAADEGATAIQVSEASVTFRGCSIFGREVSSFHPLRALAWARIDLARSPEGVQVITQYRVAWLGLSMACALGLAAVSFALVLPGLSIRRLSWPFSVL